MNTLFIGAGSMACALMRGALKSGALKKEDTYAFNRSNDVRMKELDQWFGVSRPGGGESFDLVVLAMKPKDFDEAADVIQNHLSSKTVILSVLAGIPVSYIREKLGFHGGIARAMPNTSAALGKSATAVTLDRFDDRVMKEAVVHLLDSVGLTVEVEEHQLDLITALSGSGPAYVYYMAEMMQATAVELGLPSELAQDLTIRTITGAGAMLEESGLDAEELRKNVTSPGGTTEAGIEALKAHGVEHAMFECISSARNRSEELGRQLIRTEKD